MDTGDDNRVAKVHPLDRDAATDDPYEVMAVCGMGDPAVMLDCLVQEFIGLGWNRGQLVALFHHPGYPLLCELQRFFGTDEVERRVDALVTRHGQMRFREYVAEPDCDGADADDEWARELVQIEPLADHGPCH